jgi:protein-tyrosine phosphatase
MRRPAGGVFLHGAISHLTEVGVTMIVSLLDHLNAFELGLQEEAYICSLNDIEFLNLPIRDGSVPIDSSDFLAAVDKTYRHIDAGGTVVAHCWAGVGRTGLFNASLLVRHGFDPGTAFLQVSQARGVTVPDTEEQVAWVYAHQQALQSDG